MSLSIRAFLVLGVIAAASTAWPQTRADSTSSDLQGTWVLNKSLSDTTPSMPSGDAPRGEGRGGGGGMPGGGMPGGGMPGGGFGGRGAMPPPGGMPPDGGAMPDPEQMKTAMAVMEELLRPVERLTIVQPGPLVITMIDGDGHARTFTASGKKERHQLRSGTVDVVTRWEGRALRQEISSGPMKIVQTFIRDPEQKQLVISVSTAPSRGGMAPTRRVYDADAR